MLFNIEKCHTICFPTKKNILNGHILDKDHHHSYLGIILSQDLKWANQMVLSRLLALSKGILGIPESKLYCSLVRPKLEYASSAWYLYLQKDKYHLDSVGPAFCC